MGGQLPGEGPRPPAVPLSVELGGPTADPVHRAGSVLSGASAPSLLGLRPHSRPLPCLVTSTNGGRRLGLASWAVVAAVPGPTDPFQEHTASWCRALFPWWQPEPWARGKRRLEPPEPSQPQDRALQPASAQLGPAGPAGPDAGGLLGPRPAVRAPLSLAQAEQTGQAWCPVAPGGTLGRTC